MNNCPKCGYPESNPEKWCLECQEFYERIKGKIEEGGKVNTRQE